MTKRVKSVVGGVLLVFVLAMSIFASFLVTPIENVGAEGTGIHDPGCPITNNQGTDLYNRSNATEGWTEVMTRVKKENGGYEKVVYGKPGDRITWTHCYFPGIQKMQDSYVTTSHPEHETTLSSKPSVGEGGRYELNDLSKSTLGSLSRSESQRHLTLYDDQGNRNSLDNGSYSYAPNFSRVTNLAGYYGGMYIFDDYNYAIGMTGIVHGTNGWTIGDTASYFNRAPINWRVGGDYRETQKLIQNSHAKINVSESNSDTWECKYYYKYRPTLYKGDEGYTTYCVDTAGHYACSETPNNKYRFGSCYSNASSSASRCDACGGYWHWVSTTYKPSCQGPEKEGNYSYRCAHGDDVYSFSSDNSGGAVREDSAQLIIPYNYQLSAEKVELNKTYVYAGEKATIKSAKVLVGARYNSVTDGTYATDIPYLKAQLMTYAATDSEGNNRISDYKYGEEKENNRLGSNGIYLTLPEWSVPVSTIDVNDVKAGSYLCVVLRYFPQNSGDETNYTNNKGNGQWGMSAPTCVAVAKRPSVQIWGGGLYSAGNIKLLESYKANLAGGNSGDMVVFGSWDEQAVVSIKTIEGLASGAATSEGDVQSSLASDESGFCNSRSPLSFANYSSKLGATICPNAKKVGGIATAIKTIDRKSTADALASGEANVSADNIDINNDSMYVETKTTTGKDVRYTYKAGDFNLRGATVNAGVTHLVKSDNTITITGNINYQETAYNDINQIPKLVIYAKNIIIDCSITRIDAVLLAEDNINTCNNEDKNAAINSTQLKINGTIVADTLTLNRTYGAATGMNSAIPAEIVNYDTSLLLWTMLESDTSTSDQMDITYQRELAPRY